METTLPASTPMSCHSNSSTELRPDVAVAEAVPSLRRSAHGRWRISLRGLLLITFACAVLGAIFRVYGVYAFFITAAMPLAAWFAVSLRGFGWQPIALATLAVYGPFIAMATYTLAFIPCDHCKLATWEVLPYAPAMLPMEFARLGFELKEPARFVWLGTNVALSVLLILALARVIRRRRPWLTAPVVLVALAVFSFEAYLLLALIQA